MNNIDYNWYLIIEKEKSCAKNAHDFFYLHINKKFNPLKLENI